MKHGKRIRTSFKPSDPIPSSPSYFRSSLKHFILTTAGGWIPDQWIISWVRYGKPSIWQLSSPGVELPHQWNDAPCFYESWSTLQVISFHRKLALQRHMEKSAGKEMDSLPLYLLCLGTKGWWGGNYIRGGIRKLGELLTAQLKSLVVVSHWTLQPECKWIWLH